jgi:hypothetical protein
MGVLEQMHTMAEQEVEQAKSLACKNTAVQAGWVLADVKNVCRVEEVHPFGGEKRVTRRWTMVCGFAHAATGQMWVTKIKYRTEALDPKNTEHVQYDNVLCVDPELQAWVNLVSALSRK